MDSVFNTKLWRSLFLVKLQGLPINGSEKVGGRLFMESAFIFRLYESGFSNILENYQKW